MVKSYRTKLNNKSRNKWKKGHSSVSNPTTTKFRDAAKLRYFTPLPGESKLTTEAVKQHDAINREKPRQEQDDETEVMDDDTTSVGRVTVKTFDTFASDWTSCTNKTFTKIFKKFNPASITHKNTLAVLAAITEVIKENNGTESSTEYFGALLSALESSNDDDTTAAIINLLSLGIKQTPKPVLQNKFSEALPILLKVLNQYISSDQYYLVKGTIGCISVFLRAQETAVWNEDSTLDNLHSLLAFITFSKPLIRRAARHAITVIALHSNITNVGLSQIAQYCINMLKSASTGGITVTLQTLTQLKFIMHTFPAKELKECCESILQLMTLSNVLINTCCLGTLHNLFMNGPKNMPFDMNAKLINALYDFQPPPIDSQPTQAWLAVMQEAHINLSKTKIELCAANLPKLYNTCTSFYACQRIETITAVTHTLQAITTQCIGKAVIELKENNDDIVTVIKIIESCLSFQYHPFYNHILHIISALFHACGRKHNQLLAPILRTIAELRESNQVTFINELEHAIGSAVLALGPEVIIKAIPLQINVKSDDKEFKRSWLLPILKTHITNSTLECFVKHILPIALACRKEAERLKAENDSVGHICYDLLQAQLWSLLHSFCRKPSDISATFPSIAKMLGCFLSTAPDLRNVLLNSIRRLINYSHINKREEDIKTLAKFAKNYFPILFTIYTTLVQRTDEQRVTRLAIFTIRDYLKICDDNLRKEYFDRTYNKIIAYTPRVKNIRFILDLMKYLIPYQTKEDIEKVFDTIKTNVSKCIEKASLSHQKHYYRILRQIMQSQEHEGCKEFLVQHINEIKCLLLNAFVKTKNNSKAARLGCILQFLEYCKENDTSLIVNEILPEAIMCTAGGDQFSCEVAFKILECIYSVVDLKNIMDVMLAGLTGEPQVIRCTILALAALFNKCKDSIPAEFEEKVIYNIGLLAVSSSTAIVNAVVSFIKIYLVTYPKDKVAGYLAPLFQIFSNMTQQNKNVNRNSVKIILTKLVRWYSASVLYTFVPKNDDILKKRIKNIATIQRRKKKEYALTRYSSASEIFDKFSTCSKKRNQSIEDILADSDEEDDDDDNDEYETKSRNGKNKMKSWIAEDVDDIVDFTDPRTNQKITGTDPTNIQNMTTKKKVVKNPFPLTPDGRMIIKLKDDDSDDDGEQRRSKKKKQILPGIADDDDDEIENLSDDDNDWVTFDAASTVTGRKRALSVNSNTTSSKSHKRQAVQRGIHRSLSGAGSSVSSRVSRKTEKTQGFKSGREYKGSKNGKGDSIKANRVNPYAYIPLRRDALNKRRKRLAFAQIKSVMKSAKMGKKK